MKDPRLAAEAIGTPLATGEWAGRWIYWIGALIGASLAVRSYDYVRNGFSHDYRAGS